MTATGTATATAGALCEASGVSFGYGARLVFQEIALAVRPGELVALCGPNGAGKSTLLRLLLGLHAPSRGQLFLGGAPVATLSRREIARRAALLPQDAPVDLPLTVREAVALGRLPHLERFEPEGAADAAAVARALEATDTAALAERPVAEISGGERHRVHLARALAQEAPLLLLDEPTAGLDLAHQLQALDLLRSIVDGGRGALVALHDLSLAARRCDRMILLAEGRIRADDGPAAVLTPEMLARVFRVEAEVRLDGAGRPYVLPRAPIAVGRDREDLE
ncbi:MAG TPA: ABC transporter ATP-binding protein [Polyangia bacterium]|nr:ABC transporter ATP-binding protein [Polyangia bacterium]